MEKHFIRAVPRVNANTMNTNTMNTNTMNTNTMSKPRPTPETDAAEINLGSACGQLFRSHHSEWYVKPSFARKLERERDEAREQLKELREALLRVRTWGVSSKNFDASDSYQMAEWIDNGCAGELPKPDGPWIYEKMEKAK